MARGPSTNRRIARSRSLQKTTAAERTDREDAVPSRSTKGRASCHRRDGLLAVPANAPLKKCCIVGQICAPLLSEERASAHPLLIPPPRNTRALRRICGPAGAGPIEKTTNAKQDTVAASGHEGSYHGQMKPLSDGIREKHRVSVTASPGRGVWPVATGCTCGSRR